ncbi:hypothetical protein LMF32_00235 [Desemzia sp. C1]|uniref:hypothetical protein n=1 Tax=Desemzia sp. C1 TaxID=2892016 RepID=UPI001E57CDDC|nr:hypothetical protein [Desemzia sp. C1]MCI3027562.1 hypothetical protein [Desemzia sp. C1]
MALPDFEQIYLDEAIEYITKQKDFTGNEGKERYGVVINFGGRYATTVPILQISTHNGKTEKEGYMLRDDEIRVPQGLTYRKRKGNKQLIGVIKNWRSHTDQFKPFTQSLYVDLTEDPNHPPIPIHLGFQVGRNILIEFLEGLKNIGVNHVIINLKYGHRPVEEVIEELGEEFVLHFPALTEE